MAFINLPKKKDKRISTFRKGEYASIYNHYKWRRIRDVKIKANPLCEKCMERGIYTNAEEVHHIIPFKLGKDSNEIRVLAYSIENTMSLCVECHKKMHSNFQLDLPLRMKLLNY